MSTKYQVADILLFEPEKRNILQSIQQHTDASKSVHVEMIYDALSGGNDVITLGSALDGLNYRERTIGAKHKVLRIADVCPLSIDQRQWAIENYFNTKESTHGRAYPIINTIISGINRALEHETLGHWRRIDFGFYSGSSDCSATVAELIYIIWQGVLIHRATNPNLIPFKLVTPGDIESASGMDIIKEWG